MAERAKPRNTISFKPVVTDGVAVQIAEKIRESILAGRLKVDDRLPTEDELARQFDVSRPTIREALKRLAAQHLVRSRRGPAGGTFVKRPSLSDLNANLAVASTLMVTLGEFDMDGILETRQELEMVCARLAAERRSNEHIHAMQKEIEIQQQEAISDVDFCSSDVRFHRLITQAAGNSVFSFLMHAVIEALQPVENMIIFRFREKEVIVAQHVKILAFIKSGDGEGASTAIQKQMQYIRRQFSAVEHWRQHRDAVNSTDQVPQKPVRQARARRASSR
jgi:GntR family transcriptional regulator, transcriptional repressor for pyruvate dehydrogenase complex